MMIASFLTRYRRVLVLCAASVALHYAAIDWVSGRLGDRARQSPPPVMTAQLRLTLPKHVESSAPVEEVKPLAEAPKKASVKRKPKPPPAEKVAEVASAPTPDAAADAAANAGDAGAASSAASAAVATDGSAAGMDAAGASSANASADGGAAAAGGSAGAGAGAGDAAASGTGAGASAGAGAGAGAGVGAGGQQGSAGQAQAGASQAGAAGAASAADGAPGRSLRHFKVKLPPSADFDVDVARVDADGTKWTGSAVMTWHTDGTHYRSSVEAGLSLLITRLNLLVLRSEGEIDDDGIAPVTATEKRARRAETATHFNRDAGTITFSATDASYPLLAGAQDKATVPFQLAGIGRADINQLGGDIDIQVGEDKEATIFRFQLVGEEEVETRMGKVVTMHLTRPPKPGTYSSRLDIWLAPGLNWYPVRIRNTEASGALTTQTVSRIKTTEAGK